MNVQMELHSFVLKLLLEVKFNALGILKYVCLLLKDLIFNVQEHLRYVNLFDKDHHLFVPEILRNVNQRQFVGMATYILTKSNVTMEYLTIK